MNRKSRTVVGILTATVLTGAGVATMANAVASAQPAAPAVSVETAGATVPTAAAADQLRTEQLARSVDDLAAQIRVLEQQVAAGAATTPTPTPSPTVKSSRYGSTDDQTTGATVVEHGTVLTKEPSESPDQEESSDD